MPRTPPPGAPRVVYSTSNESPLRESEPPLAEFSPLFRRSPSPCLVPLPPYDSGEDVYKGNFKSFKAKEVEKIKAKGVASFFKRKIKKWRCPYCTTKPKPEDGRFDHLVSHAEDVANCREDCMIRGRHVALAKALTPV
ncbi:hypothetical protein D1007_45735 [Hordeum vulgare]|nr:hypothetical protein D1007_45735 [Hordeum vulgare]